MIAPWALAVGQTILLVLLAALVFGEAVDL
jgi:hypothetical protein